MIEYPEDLPYQNFTQEKTRRIGLSTRGLDVARYKNIDAVVLRPMMVNNKYGPVVEIPFCMAEEVCHEIMDTANAERPVEVFGQALPVKRMEIPHETFNRLMDLVGEIDNYVRTNPYHKDEPGIRTVRKALQAVLDTGIAEE